MNTQELIEALRIISLQLPSADARVIETAAQALTASQERERVLREALENVSIWIEKNPEFRQDILFDIVHLALQSTEQQG